MTNKLLVIFIIIGANLFCETVGYEYFNIYNSEKYKLNQENYTINTDIIDMKYSVQDYKVDEISLNPKNLTVDLKSKYYQLKYNEFHSNLNELEVSDEKIEFEQEKIKYFEHQVKIPYEKYELKLTSGKINDFNFKIISDYADISLNNPSFDKKGISFRKENLALEYEKVDFGSEFLLNEVSYIGKTNGKWEEYSLDYKKSKFSYRKFNLGLDFDLDNNTAFFVTKFANHYIYGDLEIDLENLEYKQTYEKKFSKSKFSVKNTLGVIKNNKFTGVLKHEYYKDIFSLFFISIKEKTSEKEQELILDKDYIYYNIIDINYEKEIGNIILGINKTIPLTYNLDLKPVKEESEEDSNNTSEGTDSNNSYDKDKIKEILLSGIKIYLKYEF